MRDVFANTLTSKISGTSALNGYAHRLSQSYRRMIQRFDEDIRAEVEREFDQLTGQSNVEPPLLCYLPWLVAETLQVANDAFIEQAGVAYLCLDQHVQLIDDCIDRRAVVEPTKIHAASLLLTAGVGIIAEISKAPSVVLPLVHKYLEEASRAERVIRGAAGLFPPFEDYLKHVARRGATCKTILPLLASENDSWEHATNLGKVLDELALAVQLIDDLLDWPSDLRLQSDSLALRLLEYRTGKCVQGWDHEEVAEMLFSFQVVDAVLAWTGEALERATVLIPEESQLREAIQRLSGEVRAVWRLMQEDAMACGSPAERFRMLAVRATVLLQH